jgi:hypothetical protein
VRRSGSEEGDMEIMARKNIFDLLSQDFDLDREVESIWLLFNDCKMTEKPDSDEELDIGVGLSLRKAKKSFSIMDFVDTFAFSNWKSRGIYISCEGMKSGLEIDKIITNKLYKEQPYLLILLEFIANMTNRCRFIIKPNSKYDMDKNLTMLVENVKKLVSHYAHKFHVDEKKEQIIIIETNPVVTAVAEISKSEIAKKIVQYNHYSLKGDLERKQEILVALSNEIEPKRSKLKQINGNIESDLFFLFNSLSIRHNNSDGKSKNNLFSMPTVQKEYWYDETYQLYLLARLLLDNTKRMEEIKTLKTNTNCRH